MASGARRKPKIQAKSRWNAWLAFEQGEHRAVVERINPPCTKASDSAALIGSLAFLGRIHEAEELWKLESTRLSPQFRSRLRFAIAIALTRTSRFKSAKIWLKENLNDLDAREFADTEQGLGVYHYYLGDFPRAVEFARRALNRSLKTGDNYIRAFATDLYGHALVQTGKRSLGLRRLEEAKKLSSRRAASDNIRSAQLVYEAEAGFRPLSIVSELQTQLDLASAEDTFTRSNLILELARQLTLRGEWAKARSLLDTQASAIYQFENPRHEATLQMRLAEIEYRRGEVSNAIHFLQSARRCLNKVADRLYEIRVLGLELKLEKQFSQRPPPESKKQRLAELSNALPYPMNERISARAEKKAGAAFLAGEDPLGDLLDQTLSHPELGRRRILELGYFGLWPEAMGFTLGIERLVILENRDWLAISKDRVVKSDMPLSQLSLQILSELAQGEKSKEQLIEAVWGYRYDPLRHDSLVYTAIASLRRSLEENSHWIETRDSGWILRRELNLPLKISMATRRELAPPPSMGANPQPPMENINQLNLRQLLTIEELRKHPAWTVQQHRLRFEVSTMTAWRDLDTLEQKGYLIKLGRGRATCYIKGDSR